MHRPELIASASRPFQFIRFDQQIQRLARRVTQSVSQAALTASTASSGPSGPGSVTFRGAAPAKEAAPQADMYADIRREVSDAHTVLRQNLEELMTRGERLEHISAVSSELRKSSGDYYTATKKMNHMRFLKTYGPPIVAGAIVLSLLWFFVL
jgi:vesicle transport protein SEC22